jgi:hypothetical protein
MTTLQRTKMMRLVLLTIKMMMGNKNNNNIKKYGIEGKSKKK